MQCIKDERDVATFSQKLTLQEAFETDARDKRRHNSPEVGHMAQ